MENLESLKRFHGNEINKAEMKNVFGGKVPVSDGTVTGAGTHCSPNSPTGCMYHSSDLVGCDTTIYYNCEPFQAQC